MKACGIVGSPKKNGNVDLLVSEVLRGTESQGVTTHKIYLNGLKIKPCQSCGVNPSPKYCIYDDDMKTIYDALEKCDAIILGSPVYFDTVSAQVKLVIDRCSCLMPYVKRSDGTSGFEKRMKKRKKGIFIAAAGADQEFDTIQTTIKGLFNWANIDLVEALLYHHVDDALGGVRDEKNELSKAFEIGVRLIRLLQK